MKKYILPIILIVLGTHFTLIYVFGFENSLFEIIALSKVWPIALLIYGVYLFYTRYTTSEAKK